MVFAGWSVCLLSLIAFQQATNGNAQNSVKAPMNMTLLICQDIQPKTSCERLKNFGLCKTRKKSMETTCAKTCEFCVDLCENRMDMKCRKWVYFGACVTHPAFMEFNCRKMCGFCSTRNAKRSKPSCSQTLHGCCWDKTVAKGPNQEGCPKCRNDLQLCSVFYEDCVAGRNVEFMHTHCAKTCRICNKKGYTPVYAS